MRRPTSSLPPVLLLLACAVTSVTAAAAAPGGAGGLGGKSRSRHHRLREARMRLADVNGLLLPPPVTVPLPGQNRELEMDAAQFLDLDDLQQYQSYPEFVVETQQGLPIGQPPEHPGTELNLLPDSDILPGRPGLPGPWGGDQKLELSLGPCILQLYEPCTDSGSIIFYHFSAVDGRPSVLSVEDPQIPENFEPNLPTKVLIHGFAGSVDFNFTASIRQAYLLRGGYNVIVVDWGRLTQLPCYASSVLNTWQVSRCTGQLLSHLGRLQPSLRPPHLHLVGFSLGAHIAAYTSAELLSTTGMKVGRITGLDPALPAFASLSPSWKLDSTDADFVDVIHTNAGVLGKVEPTGHVDFYVNGGSLQPFCMTGDRNIPLCSHLLAPVYFSETILDETSHWGRQCPSYAHYAWGWCPNPQPHEVGNHPGVFMGEGISPRTRGTFLVETAAQYPFALGPPSPNMFPPVPTMPQDTFLIVFS
ncbi:lipase member I-like isoform X1 [Frankliniella occidentalis]|uniref:Lipase member I-like isoform X1 n=1 Tax=Frankliniella occidentalis TaxID=133901 RepID=A0A6J1S786_FRAOC|nr:lipase member I-like isoform X1 [Frankliniella occidentalis]